MKSLKLLAILFFTAMLAAPVLMPGRVEGQSVTEAPAGFDAEQIDPNDPATSDQGNGMVTPQQHVDDKNVFNKRDTIATGLGPVYNAQSCGECHQNPRTGGRSSASPPRRSRR